MNFRDLRDSPTFDSSFKTFMDKSVDYKQNLLILKMREFVTKEYREREAVRVWIAKKWNALEAWKEKDALMDEINALLDEDIKFKKLKVKGLEKMWLSATVLFDLRLVCDF